MSSDVINALKRLERAGSEGSRATKKLHDAAREIASQIETAVAAAGAIDVKLPRGYRVTSVSSNVGNAYFLVGPDRQECDEYAGVYTMNDWIDGTGSYLHGDFHAEIPPQTRQGSLQFARDISEGLLTEIAEFLEQRAAKNAQAAYELEAAAQSNPS